MATDYGSDALMWLNGATTPDLDPSFTFVDGEDPYLVAENVARRWLSSPETLAAIGDDPLGGYDLRAELGAKLNTTSALRVRTRLAAAALRDERVLGCVVNVTQNIQARSITVEATLSLVSGAKLSLVLLVTATTATLLKVA